MSPQPLEGIQGPPAVSFPQQQQQQQQQPQHQMQPPDGPRSGTISLTMLIDFIIQRTYHELTVLAELLPRKTDMERKIEIYNFSARTRQLFIRLLALVKWANSASKVKDSAHVMSVLDNQSMLFVDTADMLARIARETLVHARLPNFHIPAAVEILTTGTYSRLPTCIREKIVPPDPITRLEKKQTLLRLNQVIQHRLVTGTLMQQMRKFKIEAGRVTFRIEHEFEVSLTVMGDASDVPWRLLEIEILVEDKETGDGRSLVHPLQVNYIHQVIQARLVNNQNALDEVYNCLHFFCQSLQLEVLYTQTLKLMMDRLGDDIHVDEYVPGSRLTISYWRELTSKDPKSILGYKLTVQTDPNDKARPLAVRHLPSIGNKESSEVADRAVRSDLLSMERLLVHTVYIRSLSRLTDIKAVFQTFLKDVDYHLQGTPALLTVPVLHPCLRAEQIHITVDTHTGMLACHVPKHLDCPVIPDLHAALNSDLTKLPAIVSEIRYWVTQRRCEKTLQHLPATPHERLPLLHAADHPLTKIGRHKLFVKFNRHPTIIMIVEMKERSSNVCEMEFVFYLAQVRHSSIDESPHDDSIETDVPKVYFKVQNLITFDTFAAIHGPGTYVDESSKRRLIDGAAGAPPAKQAKTIYPAYFIPELAHVVAMCDEKLPFVCLAQELTNRKIPHSGLQVEANATSLVLKLLTLPHPNSLLHASSAAASSDHHHHHHHHHQNRIGHVPVVSKHVWTALTKRLLSVSVRSQLNKNNHSKLWSIELVFHGTPLQSMHHREQGQRRAVYFQYDLSASELIGKTVDNLLNDWSKIVYLYSIVHEFAEQYNSEKYNLHNLVTIKSYSYTNLLLAYGPNKAITVNIFWCTHTKEFKTVFTGNSTSIKSSSKQRDPTVGGNVGNRSTTTGFGGNNSAINAHSMMREQLQSHLNSNHSLAQIVHILHETYQPLASIAKLSIIPHLGSHRPQVPVLSFCILPQSPTLLRVAYQATYCLEIRLRGGGLVSIRDGAHSRFAKRNVVDEFTPTQGLKGFLSKYVDESSVYRRRSQSEDDNPPSPIAMDDQQQGPSSVGGAGSSSPFLSHRAPQSPRDGGLRFPQPITPPASTNPLTPASPHPIGQNQNFGITSPPNMPHPSPSGGLMPASPLNPQPSPMAMSPGPNYLSNHADQINSPFGVQSPATSSSNWPGSPSMPRPSPRPGQSPDHKSQSTSNVAPQLVSRVLPARSWAGAIPTLVTHEALETLCRPCSHPQKDFPEPYLISPLERFLGCGYMRRNLQRLIQSEEFLTAIKCDQPGIIMFKVDGLQCQIFLNPAHMQSLHIKITQIPPNMPDSKPYQWSLDDLQILEQFFELRVAAPPFRPMSLCGFVRMLSVPPQVLKDFIQIIRIELMPELAPNLKWNVQFCVRVPPSAAPIVPIGNAAIHMIRSKILFFLQVTRIPYLPGMDTRDSSFVLPMVYDVNTNITQLAERREPHGIQSLATNAVSMSLRRFAEYPSQIGECSIFPAVRDLLMNLTLPTDPPVQQQQQQLQQQQQQQLQNQIIPSPVGAVGHSPAPMMHSPMHMSSGGGGGGGGGGIHQQQQQQPQQQSYGTAGPN